MFNNPKTKTNLLKAFSGKKSKNMIPISNNNAIRSEVGINQIQKNTMLPEVNQANDFQVAQDVPFENTAQQIIQQPVEPQEINPHDQTKFGIKKDTWRRGGELLTAAGLARMKGYESGQGGNMAVAAIGENVLEHQKNKREVNQYVDQLNKDPNQLNKYDARDYETIDELGNVYKINKQQYDDEIARTTAGVEQANKDRDYSLNERKVKNTENMTSGKLSLMQTQELLNKTTAKVKEEQIKLFGTQENLNNAKASYERWKPTFDRMGINIKKYISDNQVNGQINIQKMKNDLGFAGVESRERIAELNNAVKYSLGEDAINSKAESYYNNMQAQFGSLEGITKPGQYGGDFKQIIDSNGESRFERSGGGSQGGGGLQVVPPGNGENLPSVIGGGYGGYNPNQYGNYNQQGNKQPSHTNNRQPNNKNNPDYLPPNDAKRKNYKKQVLTLLKSGDSRGQEAAKLYEKNFGEKLSVQSKNNVNTKAQALSKSIKQKQTSKTTTQKKQQPLKFKGQKSFNDIVTNDFKNAASAINNFIKGKKR